MTEQTPETYTTAQAMTALGIKARSAFHHLRKQYPKAFIVVQVGTGRFQPTLYDKAAIDDFIHWRKIDKSYSHYLELTTPKE